MLVKASGLAEVGGGCAAVEIKIVRQDETSKGCCEQIWQSYW